MRHCTYIVLALLLSACATPPPNVVQLPAQVVRVDTEKEVMRPCPDKRPARDYKDLPDDPEDLAMVPAGDYEKLFRIAKETIRMTRAWLALDEVQIKGCSGN